MKRCESLLLVVGLSMFFAAAAPAQDYVHSTATLSEARSYLAMASIGDLLLFAGGQRVGYAYTDTVDIYDTSSGQWSVAHLSQPRGRMAATTVGERVLFAGGLSSLDSAAVDIYDSGTGQWSTAWLSRPSRSLAGATVGSLALFAGGGRVDIYDDATGLWTSRALSDGRSAMSAVTIGNKVLFAGGIEGQTVSNAVDIFDAATGVWTTASLFQQRYHIAAFAVGDKAYFVGGQYDNQGAHTTNIVDVYDSTTGIWSIQTLPYGRSGDDLAFLGDKVLLPRYFPDSSYLDFYDPTTGRIEGRSFWYANYNLSVEALGDSAYFAGGSHSDFSSVVDILTIPEPCMMALLGVGALALGRRRRL